MSTDADRPDPDARSPRGTRRGAGARVRSPRVIPRDESEAEEPGSPGHPGLELNDDLEAQLITWKVQRWGWLAFALILGAALLGLMGRGPLSHSYVIQHDAPLALEFERFGRHGSGSQVRIHLLPGASRDGRARVRLDREFYENVDDLQVIPEPSESEAGAEWVTLTIATDRPDRPTVVVVDYVPQGYGPLRCRVGLEEGEPIRFQQFVYP